jgi:hypothetical protein
MFDISTFKSAKRRPGTQISTGTPPWIAQDRPGLTTALRIIGIDNLTLSVFFFII